MRDDTANELGLMNRWKFNWHPTVWWRFGFWVHVDLKTPMLSICLGWFIFGFGKMIVWGEEDLTNYTKDTLK